jgi:putative PIN family toxin of toxin-antitoxin system
MFVFDTDVVVAAIRSRTGASAMLVRAALLRRCPIAASVAMILEYEAVVTRRQHLDAAGLTAAQAMTVIDGLASVAIRVAPSFRWRPQLRDPDDEMILEAAVNGRADAIVTFNRRDFRPAADRFGVGIVSPGEALETLK